MHSSTFWREAVLSESISIQDAIQNLDQTSLRVVMIVGESGKLLGTVSDGDIRRGLLRGLDLKTSVSTVVNRAPLIVPSELTRESVMQLMTANRVQQIPIVDNERRVIGLHVWDALTVSPNRENLMIIMAGGRGIRLRPHTENCPKPLVSVAGKPMLEHIIERGRLAGFSRYIVSIHYLGHMIEEYFGDGGKLGVHIDYLRENQPLGTAGGLGLLQPISDAPFVVTNGDVLSDINYGDLLDFHVRHEAAATMAVRQHEWQNPYGVVQTQGLDILGFEEKPVSRSYINAGVYALSPKSLSFLPKGFCDMPTLFDCVRAQNLRTIAYPMHEPWLDVGRPEDLKLAQDF